MNDNTPTDVPDHMIPDETVVLGEEPSEPDEVRSVLNDGWRIRGENLSNPCPECGRSWRSKATGPSIVRYHHDDGSMCEVDRR